MLLNPIIERDLKIALRVRQATKSRFRVAMYGSILVGIMLLLQLVAGGHTIGRTMERWLFYAGLFLSVFPALNISAGMFSEERRNRTLELLYLTGINEGELFLGKLLGGMLVASTDLLALAPMLAVPFLCGGISFDLFLATVVCLPILLLFALAVGTFGSVLATDEGTAQVMTVAVGAVVVLAFPLPYFMGNLLRGAPPFSARWLSLSPGWGPYLVWHYFGTTRVSEFWKATGISLLWTLFFLVAAAFVLRRNWRQDVEKSRAEKTASGLVGALAKSRLMQKFVARQKVTGNPFQWLVETDKRTPLLSLQVMGGISLFWLGCWALWRQAWLSTLNLMLTAVVVLIVTYWLELFAASRRLGEDRRDGALELLLTTSLSPAEIVEGQLAGLRRQFREVRCVRFGLFVAMMAGGFLWRNWTPGAVATYVMVWIVLLVSSLLSAQKSIVAVLWVALNSGRPLWSVMGIQRGSKVLNAWNLFNWFRFLPAFGFMIHLLAGFPTGHPAEICIVAFIFVIWGILIIAGREMESHQPMRQKLINEMRAIAQDPVPDPKDPRLAKWNPKERFS
jgi:ABC-type transport system involved in multi-copper enzyme maturation permease subunit